VKSDYATVYNNTKITQWFLTYLWCWCQKASFWRYHWPKDCVWFDINRVLGVEITVFWDVKCVLCRNTFVLKMEAKCSSETLLRMYKTGRRHMSEHRNLNQWQTLGDFYDLTCNTSCLIHPPKFNFFVHFGIVWRSTQTSNAKFYGAKLSKLNKERVNTKVTYYYKNDIFLYGLFSSLYIWNIKKI